MKTIEQICIIQPSSAYGEFAPSCLLKENGLGKTLPGNPQHGGYSSEKCSISIDVSKYPNPGNRVPEAAIFNAVSNDVMTLTILDGPPNPRLVSTVTSNVRWITHNSENSRCASEALRLMKMHK